MTIRDIASGFYWSDDAVTGVAVISNTFAGIHWSGNIGTGVVVIRKTVADYTGLEWWQSETLIPATLVW